MRKPYITYLALEDNPEDPNSPHLVLRGKIGPEFFAMAVKFHNPITFEVIQEAFEEMALRAYSLSKDKQNEP